MTARRITLPLLLSLLAAAPPARGAGLEPASPPAAGEAGATPPAWSDEARWRAGQEPPVDRWLPVLESVGFNLGLNLYARFSKPPGNEFETGPGSIGRNATGAWVYDVDPFGTNELQHPYQGTISFTAARATGSGFYGAFLYAAGGSLLWEWAGETEAPSINDQWTTTAGGTLLGEVLYRVSSLVLDGGGGRPGPWREGLAALVSPSTGFNRLLHGNRFREPGLSENPWRAELRLAGAVRGTSVEEGTPHTRSGALELSARMIYGLPAGDWTFRKPFDHFDAQLGLAASGDGATVDGFMTLLLRGLILGTAWGSGTSRGLWGLFGQYDYISPEVFRVSSSGIGLGATAQHVGAAGLAVAGTALATLGFGAGGASRQPVGARDYHFGSTLNLTGEGQVDWAGRVAVKLQARHYLVSGRASPDVKTFESLDYGAVAVVLRIAGAHALGADLSLARRRAVYQSSPEVQSRANAVHLFYLLGSDATLGIARGPSP